MSDIVDRLRHPWAIDLDDKRVEYVPAKMGKEAAAEIERLRARVAELEADNADFKKLIADELAETFKLFGILGLNEADDFGTKTAIEAVRERIESIKADRDRWKAIADSRHAIIESLEWCQDSMDDDGTFRRCPTCSAFEPEIHESDCAVAKAIAESARADINSASNALRILYANLKTATTAMERCGLTAMVDGIRADIVTEPCVSALSKAVPKEEI